MIERDVRKSKKKKEKKKEKAGHGDEQLCVSASSHFITAVYPRLCGHLSCAELGRSIFTAGRSGQAQAGN